MPLARRLLTARASSATLLLVLLLSASTQASCHHVAARNVTAILSARQDLAEFSRALTATGLADAVNNAKDAVTVLAVDDVRMAPLRASGLPRDALRRVLSRHVLVGYQDDASLRLLLTVTGAKDVVAHTVLDVGATAGTVKIVARHGQSVAFVPLDDARAAAAFYVGLVVHDALRNNVSVLLVSGVMWGPAAAHTEPRLLDASTAPAPAPPKLGPSSRAGASRLVSPDAVTSTTQFKAPIDVARSSSARDAVLPVQQVTPDTRSVCVSALQEEEEGGIPSPATEAASPPEPRPGPDDSAAAPWPSAPPDRALDASIFTIFGILLACYLVLCCCSSQQPDP